MDFNDVPSEEHPSEKDASAGYYGIGISIEVVARKIYQMI